MKKIIVLVLVVIVLFFGFKIADRFMKNKEASTEGFVKQVEEALEKEGSEAFLDLACWGEIDEELKSMQSDSFLWAFEDWKMPEYKDKKVSLSDEKFENEKVISQGFAYSPILPVLGQIEIRLEEEQLEEQESPGYSQYLFPFGKKDGKYCFVTVKKEPVESGVCGEEKQLEAYLSTFGEVDGYCEYAYCGEIKKINFEDSDIASYFEKGEYFISCNVKELTGAEELSLELHEGDAVIFYDEVGSGESIEYSRP